MAKVFLPPPIARGEFDGVGSEVTNGQYTGLPKPRQLYMLYAAKVDRISIRALAWCLVDQ